MEYFHSKETRQKLSDMRKGDRNPFYGRKHTDETKAKMAAWTRRFNANRTYDLSNRKTKVLSSTDAAYLAGLVDGEGSISFVKGRPRLSVYNTSIHVMDWLTFRVGGPKPASSKPRENHAIKGRKPMFQWSISAARDVWMICQSMMPYLVIKKRNAEEVLAFLHDKYGIRLHG